MVSCTCRIGYPMREVPIEHCTPASFWQGVWCFSGAGARAVQLVKIIACIIEPLILVYGDASVRLVLAILLPAAPLLWFVATLLEHRRLRRQWQHEARQHAEVHNALTNETYFAILYRTHNQAYGVTYGLSPFLQRRRKPRSYPQTTGRKTSCHAPFAPILEAARIATMG
jgi:hypothetical protein